MSPREGVTGLRARANIVIGLLGANVRGITQRQEEKIAAGPVIPPRPDR